MKKWLGTAPAVSVGLLLSLTPSVTWACAVEYDTLDGVTFPANGAESVPLNARLLVFPDNEAPDKEAILVTLLDEDGQVLGMPPFDYDDPGGVWIVELDGLLAPSASYTVAFEVKPDGPPGNDYPEDGLWRDPISFGTGSLPDVTPPGAGSMDVTLHTTFDVCCGDGEACGPWGSTPRPVTARVRPTQWTDDGPLAYRLWWRGYPRAFGVGSGAIRANIMQGDCCHADYACDVACVGPLLAETIELEAFDLAGNTTRSAPWTPNPEDLGGYEDIVFVGGSEDAGPSTGDGGPALDGGTVEPEPDGGDNNIACSAAHGPDGERWGLWGLLFVVSAFRRRSVADQWRGHERGQ